MLDDNEIDQLKAASQRIAKDSPSIYNTMKEIAQAAAVAGDPMTAMITAIHRVFGGMKDLEIGVIAGLISSSLCASEISVDDIYQVIDRAKQQVINIEKAKNTGFK